jgi:hypothetical protein
MRPLVVLVTSKLGLGKFLSLSRFARSTADASGGDSSVKRSNRSDSRGEVVLPSFVTPQSLRVTAESTRRQDRNNNAFYRLPDDNRSGGFNGSGILVETSLEWGLESEGKGESAAGAHVTQITPPRRNETTYDSSSSIEMERLSAATSKSEIPMQRWK